MNLNEVKSFLRKNPVIPALRTSEDLDEVLKLKDRVVFLLETSVGKYQDCVRKLKDAGHIIFVHADLIKGLKMDEFGSEFILTERPSGIISTHKSTLEWAKKQGLMQIYRVFLIDSEALKNGEQLIRSTRPDFVEILPGLVMLSLEINFGFPLIAGGLISKKDHVDELLKRGIFAVSTSNKNLWYN
ncbi:glycerol-3-phosphate responsive antiterminator [Athalassotoga saccharophila]|uniref:glycerol-3-phosphate responsive antiterminator n=1 Tax=Athalassotoga saccharophila TaxID=1441386 RepID=UPI0013793B06|nr:glycerol-3-phosphate responsive antiterminator [Athalassotoga saccharophila]BBJ28288.1 glycerol uptake operon antiterminator regulatory protein [Athalassotoga saccharophila]